MNIGTIWLQKHNDTDIKVKQKQHVLPQKTWVRPGFSILKHLIVIFVLVIQNRPIRTLFIGWDILIGRIRNTNAKLVLESSITISSDAPEGLSFLVPLT